MGGVNVSPQLSWVQYKNRDGTSPPLWPTPSCLSKSLIPSYIPSIMSIFVAIVSVNMGPCPHVRCVITGDTRPFIVVKIHWRRWLPWVVMIVAPVVCLYSVRHFSVMCWWSQNILYSLTVTRNRPTKVHNKYKTVQWTTNHLFFSGCSHVCDQHFLLLYKLLCDLAASSSPIHVHWNQFPFCVSFFPLLLTRVYWWWCSSRDSVVWQDSLHHNTHCAGCWSAHLTCVCCLVTALVLWDYWIGCHP